MLGSSRVAAQLAASQERLGSMSDDDDDDFNNESTSRSSEWSLSFTFFAETLYALPSNP
jgi:hypothetical protein